ncbi:MAG: hypothetical protein GY847_23620 [Proteobacteria bacterium]|nr:hypothetical protein [Pseudomonadota bacterium]
METRYFKKPDGVIDFEDVFRRHPEESFVGRQRINAEIDDFLKAKAVKSPYLFIQGESGIGKTALMANYVRCKRDEYIHYFIEFGTDTTRSQTFVDHLYYSLCWKYGRRDHDPGGHPITPAVLKNEVWKISKDLLKADEVQAVFIDSLDESFCQRVPEDPGAIADVINTIRFPANFRVVITSSRNILEGNELRALAETSRPLKMFGQDEENRPDVEQYLRKAVCEEGIADDALGRLVDACEGNFRYAELSVSSIVEEGLQIDSILRGMPNGLWLLYGSALQRIHRQVGDSTYQNIRKAVFLITVASQPLSTWCIRDILGLDEIESSSLFGPLEQFLDLSMYDSMPHKCRWSHKSFQQRVNNGYMSETDRQETLERLADYTERQVAEVAHNPEIAQLLVGYPKHCMTLGNARLIRFMKTHLREYLYSSTACGQSKAQLLLNLSFFIAASIKIRLLDHFAFFTLVYLAYDLAQGPEITGRPIRERIINMVGDKSFGGKRLTELLPEIDSSDYLARYNAHKAIKCFEERWGHVFRVGTAIEAGIALMRTRTGDFEDGDELGIDFLSLLMSMSPPLYLIIKDNYNLADIIVVCERCCTSWFSPDDIDEGELIGAASPTSTKATERTDQTPAKSEYKEALYIIYEDWSDPKPVDDEQELKDYLGSKDPKDYDIWVKEPGDYYHLGKSVSIRGWGKLLKTMLQSAHTNVVYLVDLYIAIGMHCSGDELVNPENLRRLRRELSVCNVAFGKCINSKKNSRWKYEDRPHFRFPKRFRYCYIEDVRG